MERTYPDEKLRDLLLREAGVSRSQHSRSALRTILYSAGTPPPDGASADQLAMLIIEIARARGRPTSTY
jgi:hypothetical protein